MTRPRVALATCAAYPDLDEDNGLLVPALAARGVEGIPVVWDDPGVAWDGFDLTVIRSTWDYAMAHQRFLRWADQVQAASGLANPAHAVWWNTDKSYLAELSGQGVPVVPTTFVDPGPDPWVPPPSGGYVVKPTVSSGSRDTARFTARADDAAAGALVRHILTSGRTAMVQPYLDSVDTSGETALLYIGGAFSHAVRKGPLLVPGAAPTTALFAEEDISPRTPTVAQREVGEAVLAAVPVGVGDLLYARIDLLDTPEGPVLLELELTEPSLFLATDEGAPGRFAGAIAARLR